MHKLILKRVQVSCSNKSINNLFLKPNIIIKFFLSPQKKTITTMFCSVLILTCFIRVCKEHVLYLSVIENAKFHLERLIRGLSSLFCLFLGYSQKQRNLCVYLIGCLHYDILREIKNERIFIMIIPGFL